MAAKRSTIYETITPKKDGEYSLIKSDVAIEKGIAIIIAEKEVIKVPRIKGKAPNSFLTGFHSLLMTNFRPNFRIEGRDVYISKKKIKITRKTTTNPARKRTALNKVSPEKHFIFFLIII